MIVNGKEIQYKESNTISDVLEELNLNKDKVVVELDKEIIPREMFEQRKVKENSILEVISFVGGGWLSWIFL